MQGLCIGCKEMHSGGQTFASVCCDHGAVAARHVCLHDIVVLLPSEPDAPTGVLLCCFLMSFCLVGWVYMWLGIYVCEAALRVVWRVPCVSEAVLRSLRGCRQSNKVCLDSVSV